MNLKVNNCGECPLAMRHDRYKDKCGHPEIRSEGWPVFFDEPKVLNNCHLKTSPITIKLNEDESK